MGAPRYGDGLGDREFLVGIDGGGGGANSAGQRLQSGRKARHQDTQDIFRGDHYCRVRIGRKGASAIETEVCVFVYVCVCARVCRVCVYWRVLRFDMNV